MHAKRTNAGPGRRNPSADGADSQHELQQLLERAVGETRVQQLRYQDLFEFAPDGYLVTDLHGIILEANHAVAGSNERDRLSPAAKGLGLIEQGLGNAACTPFNEALISQTDCLSLNCRADAATGSRIEGRRRWDGHFSLLGGDDDCLR